MSTLEEALGIDPNSPADRRALALIEADADLLSSLISIRKQAELSQKAVAKLLGISQASVAAFERYENDPKLSTIRRYSQAVGALVTHLVERDVGQLFERDGFVAKRVTSGLKVTVLETPAGPTFVDMPSFARRTDFALSA
jgi:transcriptional regulator with XRE-family HTH domain